MNRVPLDSSCIASIGYDPKRRELEIEFLEHRDVYRYIDVPPEEYAAFMASESKGAYLNEVFKPRNYHYDVVRQEKEVMTSTERITERIEVNPEIMLGKPVIRGTRVPVELILRKLSEGATEADLLDAHPNLSRADIQAAIRYAADTLAHQEVVFLSGSRSTRE